MIRFVTRFKDEEVLRGLGHLLHPYAEEDPWPVRKDDGAYVCRGNNWFLRRKGTNETLLEALAKTHYTTTWELSYRYMSGEKEAALAMMLDWILGFRVEESTRNP